MEKLKAFGYDLGLKLVRKRKLETGVKRELLKCLGIPDLIGIGVGATIGAGIFVLTGIVAKTMTGPAIVLSFLFAGIACIFSGLCYAEFAARIPTSGSAYLYAYCSVGELIAWFIGWDLILEVN